MSMLILGLVIFLGVHSTSIFAPAWRNRQAAALGDMAWKGIYALLSLVGFALILHGYGQARGAPVLLYQPPAALRHVAWLLMLPVFPLLLASYLPGRISAITRHPMLVATKLWALAHLLANGTLASTVLFGSFPTAGGRSLTQLRCRGWRVDACRRLLTHHFQSASQLLVF